MTDTLTSTTIVAAALADVLDAGCRCADPKHGKWVFDGEDEDSANRQRMDFVHAVVRRIKELQSPPLSLGVLNAGLCARHVFEVFPTSTMVRCPKCIAEALNVRKDAQNPSQVRLEIESQES